MEKKIFCFPMNFMKLHKLTWMQHFVRITKMNGKGSSWLKLYCHSLQLDWLGCNAKVELT